VAQDTRKLIRIDDEVLAPWRPIAERERRSLTKMAEVVLERALPAWEEQRDQDQPKAAA
jgi:hypothetical protein